MSPMDDHRGGVHLKQMTAVGCCPVLFVPVGSLRQNVMGEGRQVCHTIFILHRWGGGQTTVAAVSSLGRAFPDPIKRQRSA